MATTTKAALQTLQSKLQAMGGPSAVVIGEPKSKVQSGLVAIIPEGGRIDETVLNAPREIHVVTLRRFENAMQGPEEEIEFRLDAWRAEIMEDAFGDFDLGGNVAYLLPTEMPWVYGYVTVENTIYRFLDITLTFRVDPVAVFVA